MVVQWIFLDALCGGLPQLEVRDFTSSCLGISMSQSVQIMEPDLVTSCMLLPFKKPLLLGNSE